MSNGLNKFDAQLSAYPERRFPLTTEGYEAAVVYLKEIGEWEYVSTHGLSVDGWSITDTANSIWWKKNGYRIVDGRWVKQL